MGAASAFFLPLLVLPLESPLGVLTINGISGHQYPPVPTLFKNHNMFGRGTPQQAPDLPAAFVLPAEHSFVFSVLYKRAYPANALEPTKIGDSVLLGGPLLNNMPESPFLPPLLPLASSGPATAMRLRIASGLGSSTLVRVKVRSDERLRIASGLGSSTLR